jgi:CHASE3 domain sensor protein
MDRQIKKIKDLPGYVMKGEDTVLNTNQDALAAYKRRRAKMRQITDQDKRISDLEALVADMQKQLKDLTK